MCLWAPALEPDLNRDDHLPFIFIFPARSHHLVILALVARTPASAAGEPVISLSRGS